MGSCRFGPSGAARAQPTGRPRRRTAQGAPRPWRFLAAHARYGVTRLNKTVARQIVLTIHSAVAN